MRKLLLALILLCLSFTSFSQTPQIDTVRELLQHEKRDTARSRLLSRLGFLYLDSHPDTALILARQAIDLARAQNDPVLEARALNVLAAIFSTNGNYPKSLDYYFQALKKYESNHEEGRVGSVLANIGTVYLDLSDFRKSLEYTFKAKEIKERQEDKLGMATTYLNIGVTYGYLGILDSARLYTTMASEIGRKFDLTSVLGNSFIGLGSIYSKMAEPVIALGYYRAALPVLKQSYNHLGLCDVLLEIARVFKLSRQSDSLLHYARLSAQLARDRGFMLNLLEASNLLSEEFNEIGKVDSAYAYLKTTLAIKDSLFSEEKTRQVQNLILEETVRQQDLEQEKLAANRQRSQNIQYAMIAITVLSFAVIFFVLSRSLIVNEKWIKFLGILGLLLVFEFINLVLHPVLGSITHHSPVWMLLILVGFAALLIPLHHRLEHFIVHQLTVKNKRMRLEAAKRKVAKLEQDMKLLKGDQGS